MKRRKFLHNTGSAITLPILLNGLNVGVIKKSSFFNSMIDSDRVLVLINLVGGNDGLSMIIPKDQQSQLAMVRPDLKIPDASILDIEDTVGLHPVMTGIQNLYQQEFVSIVQSVGYPNQNRSHFRSTDIWSTASPSDEVWKTGWLGRHFEQDHAEFPDGYPNNDNPDPFAITIGALVSDTCQGTIANFSMAILDPANLTTLATGGEDEVPDTPYGEQLTFLRTAIDQTNQYSDTITTAANAGTNMAAYPADNRLAKQLEVVANLISGDLKTNVYVVSLGGFDTHANQVDGDSSTTGQHAALLNTLSEAIASFQEDINLQGLGERVLGMTFSEFGRRIRANDSLGTDHGTAAPLMPFWTMCTIRCDG